MPRLTKPCSGHALFAEFAEKTGLSVREIARQIGVRHPTIIGWRDGTLRPSEKNQRRIQKWTRRKVRIASWRVAGARAPEADVRPFRAARPS